MKILILAWFGVFASSSFVYASHSDVSSSSSEQDRENLPVVIPSADSPDLPPSGVRQSREIRRPLLRRVNARDLEEFRAKQLEKKQLRLDRRPVNNDKITSPRKTSKETPEPTPSGEPPKPDSCDTPAAPNPGDQIDNGKNKGLFSTLKSIVRKNAYEKFLEQLEKVPADKEVYLRDKDLFIEVNKHFKSSAKLEKFRESLHKAIDGIYECKIKNGDSPATPDQKANCEKRVNVFLTNVAKAFIEETPEDFKSFLRDIESITNKKFGDKDYSKKMMMSALFLRWINPELAEVVGESRKLNKNIDKSKWILNVSILLQKLAEKGGDINNGVVAQFNDFFTGTSDQGKEAEKILDQIYTSIHTQKKQ